MNRRGSKMLMVSSVARSLDERFELLSVLSVLSVFGSGGGEVLGRGGVTDRRDLLEFRDGVRYGVSVGVGKAAAAAMRGPSISSSVSHTAILGISAPWADNCV